MDSSLQVLADAVRDQSAILIMARAEQFGLDMLRVLNAQFESESNAAGEAGIWAKIDAGRPADGNDLEATLRGLVTSGKTVEVSFETPHAKVFFDSALRTSRGGRWRGRRVLLAMPQSVKVVERRRGEREPIPDDVMIQARLLRVPSGAYRADPFEAEARVLDLGRLGASLICPAVRPLMGMVPEEKVIALFQYGGRQHEIAARPRYVQSLPPDGIKVGLQFSMDDAKERDAVRDFAPLVEEFQALRVRRSFRSTLHKGFTRYGVELPDGSGHSPDTDAA